MNDHGHGVCLDRTSDVCIPMDTTFSEMFLIHEDIRKGLKEADFIIPSPIQRKALPRILCGFDTIFKAKSGTGKTAVFAITALQTVIDLKCQQAQVLILAPTREIAVQIVSVISVLGAHIPDLKTQWFIGGTPLQEDQQKLENCRIVVGAPGRIAHLIELGYLNTSSIRLFVIDEADEMIQPSFYKDFNFIFNSLPENKQILICSATFTPDILNFLRKYMTTYSFISGDKEDDVEEEKLSFAPLIGVKPFISIIDEKYTHNNVYMFAQKEKRLRDILKTTTFSKCVIFTNYITRTKRIHNELNASGFLSSLLSSGQTQSERLQALEDFKHGGSRILVTTDLTARGIDVQKVDTIINFEVPTNEQVYLHRMGRAGRYGSYGVVITIVAEGDELLSLRKILGSIQGTVTILPPSVNSANVTKMRGLNLKELSGVALEKSQCHDVESADKGNEVLLSSRIQPNCNRRIKDDLSGSNPVSGQQSSSSANLGKYYASNPVCSPDINGTENNQMVFKKVFEEFYDCKISNYTSDFLQRQMCNHLKALKGVMKPFESKLLLCAGNLPIYHNQLVLNSKTYLMFCKKLKFFNPDLQNLITLFVSRSKDKNLTKDPKTPSPINQSLLSNNVNKPDNTTANCVVENETNPPFSASADLEFPKFTPCTKQKPDDTLTGGFTVKNIVNNVAKLLKQKGKQVKPQNELKSFNLILRKEFLQQLYSTACKEDVDISDFRVSIEKNYEMWSRNSTIFEDLLRLNPTNNNLRRYNLTTSSGKPLYITDANIEFYFRLCRTFKSINPALVKFVESKIEDMSPTKSTDEFNCKSEEVLRVETYCNSDFGTPSDEHVIETLGVCARKPAVPLASHLIKRTSVAKTSSKSSQNVQKPFLLYLKHEFLQQLYNAPKLNKKFYIEDLRPTIEPSFSQLWKSDLLTTKEFSKLFKLNLLKPPTKRLNGHNLETYYQFCRRFKTLNPALVESVETKIKRIHGDFSGSNNFINNFPEIAPEEKSTLGFLDLKFLELYYRKEASALIATSDNDKLQTINWQIDDDIQAKVKTHLETIKSSSSFFKILKAESSKGVRNIFVNPNFDINFFVTYFKFCKAFKNFDNNFVSYIDNKIRALNSLAEEYNFENGNHLVEKNDSLIKNPVEIPETPIEICEPPVQKLESINQIKNSGVCYSSVNHESDNLTSSITVIGDTDNMLNSVPCVPAVEISETVNLNESTSQNNLNDCNDIAYFSSDEIITESYEELSKYPSHKPSAKQEPKLPNPTLLTELNNYLKSLTKKSISNEVVFSRKDENLASKIFTILKDHKEISTSSFENLLEKPGPFSENSELKESMPSAPKSTGVPTAETKNICSSFVSVKSDAEKSLDSYKELLENFQSCEIESIPKSLPQETSLLDKETKNELKILLDSFADKIQKKVKLAETVSNPELAISLMCTDNETLSKNFNLSEENSLISKKQDEDTETCPNKIVKSRNVTTSHKVNAKKTPKLVTSSSSVATELSSAPKNSSETQQKVIPDESISKSETSLIKKKKKESKNVFSLADGSAQTLNQISAAQPSTLSTFNFGTQRHPEYASEVSHRLVKDNFTAEATKKSKSLKSPRQVKNQFKLSPSESMNLCANCKCLYEQETSDVRSTKNQTVKGKKNVVKKVKRKRKSSPEVSYSSDEDATPMTNVFARGPSYEDLLQWYNMWYQQVAFSRQFVWYSEYIRQMAFRK